jgi:hypothetical protein
VKKKTIELASAVTVLIWSLWIFLNTLNMKSFSAAQIEPQTVPQLTSAVLFIFGLRLLLQWFIKNRGGFFNNESNTERALPKLQRHTPLLTFILIFIYIYTIKLIGFTFSTTIYLTLQITLLSADFKIRNFVKNAVIGLLVALLVFFIFNKGFSLVLPVSLFGI